MNEKSKISHNYIAGGLAVLAFLAIAAYMYFHQAAPAYVENTATSTPITTNIDGVTVSGGDAAVADVPSQTVKVPDFKTPIAFGDAFTNDVRVALSAQLEEVIKIIEGDSQNFNAWIKLGIIRKMAGDYKGAESAWSYVKALYPKSTVPTDNLGSLYLDFIKNYPKAETNYKLSISSDSHDINAYEQLVSLYTIYGYGSTTTALTLLQQGIAANPNNQTLLQLQTQLSN